jgi:hypothetical protein
MSLYTVVSIHNGEIGAGGSKMDRGEFNDGDAALARAKQLVNDALLEHFDAATSADMLMRAYTMRGSEVPMIYGEPRIQFHAYQYARERSNAMFAAIREKPQEGT